MDYNIKLNNYITVTIPSNTPILQHLDSQVVFCLTGTWMVCEGTYQMFCCCFEFSGQTGPSMQEVM